MKNLGLVVMFAVAVACGGNKPKPTTAAAEPQWLSQGNGAVATEAGKQIHAIGMVQGVRASKARREQADQKAKEQLDQTMDQVFAQLSRMSEITRDNLSDEVTAIGKKALAQTAKIQDHWVSGDTESALDVVDLNAFKAALAKVDGDDQLKNEMASKVDRAVEQLAK